MSRPRTRLHLRDPRHDTWSVCGQFHLGTRLTDIEDEVDCLHCRRRIDNEPAPAQYSGKARWKAMKQLAANHADEYAELLAKAEAEVRAEASP